MDFYHLYIYTGFVYVAIIAFLIYVDYCSLKNRKSKIWSSIQGDTQYYRNVKTVMKARIFAKIIIILFSLSIICDYAIYRNILIHRVSWIMAMVLLFSLIIEGRISYKNDDRGKWVKLSRYYPAFVLGLSWLISRYLL